MEESRAPDLPLSSPYEALILASIVEKETGRAVERSLIAGVFLNRLKMGMRLQTDPTVIYGLGERFDGNLRKQDLVTDNPYNTYTRAGMPPTPIANPGVEALKAVAHPDSHNYLYFVAKGATPAEGHVFAETYAEHQANVRRYLGNYRQARQAREAAEADAP